MADMLSCSLYRKKAGDGDDHKVGEPSTGDTANGGGGNAQGDAFQGSGFQESGVEGQSESESPARVGFRVGGASLRRLPSRKAKQYFFSKFHVFARQIYEFLHQFKPKSPGNQGANESPHWWAHVDVNIYWPISKCQNCSCCEVCIPQKQPITCTDVIFFTFRVRSQHLSLCLPTDVNFPLHLVSLDLVSNCWGGGKCVFVKKQNKFSICT